MQISQGVFEVKSPPVIIPSVPHENGRENALSYEYRFGDSRILKLNNLENGKIELMDSSEIKESSADIHFDFQNNSHSFYYARTIDSDALAPEWGYSLIAQIGILPFPFAGGSGIVS
jgi:hypothetical protein